MDLNCLPLFSLMWLPMHAFLLIWSPFLIKLTWRVHLNSTIQWSRRPPTHTPKKEKKRKVIQRNEVAYSNYVAPWVLMIFRSCMKISISHCYLLLSWRTSCHKNVLLRQNLKTRNAAQNNRVGVEFPLIILGYMTWHGKSHNSSNLILYKFGVIAWHGA